MDEWIKEWIILLLMVAFIGGTGIGTGYGLAAGIAFIIGTLALGGFIISLGNMFRHRDRKL